MSIQDPISDMLTRIRNAQAVFHQTVSMPTSKLKVAIAKVLVNEGYVIGLEEIKNEHGKMMLSLQLKYFEGRPVIKTLKRKSGPSLRIYEKRDTLPEVDHGLGIAIVSNSKGVMTAKEARNMGQGGEVLCIVS